MTLRSAYRVTLGATTPIRSQAPPFVCRKVETPAAERHQPRESYPSGECQDSSHENRTPARFTEGAPAPVLTASDHRGLLVEQPDYRKRFFERYPRLQVWKEQLRQVRPREVWSLGCWRRLLEESAPDSVRFNAPVQVTAAGGLKAALASRPGTAGTDRLDGSSSNQISQFILSHIIPLPF